jgi:hypothetical protein
MNKFMVKPNGLQILLLGVFAAINTQAWILLTQPIQQAIFPTFDISNLAVQICVGLSCCLVLSVAISFVLWIIYCAIIYKIENNKAIN